MLLLISKNIYNIIILIASELMWNQTVTATYTLKLLYAFLHKHGFYNKNVKDLCKMY